MEVITFSCGNFPNVHLIGSNGCINYNPILALRQLSYPMLEKLEDELLKSFVFHDVDANDSIMLQRIIQSL